MPATTRMPTTIATSTIVVPMSGWMKTRSIGTADTMQTRSTSGSIGSDVRSSDSIAASIRISAIFANSDGVNWKPANSNHRCAPFAVEPMPGTRTRISARPSPRR